MHTATPVTSPTSQTNLTSANETIITTATSKTAATATTTADTASMPFVAEIMNNLQYRNLNSQRMIFFFHKNRPKYLNYKLYKNKKRITYNLHDALYKTFFS